MNKMQCILKCNLIFNLVCCSCHLNPGLHALKYYFTFPSWEQKFVILLWTIVLLLRHKWEDYIKVGLK